MPLNKKDISCWIESENAFCAVGWLMWLRHSRGAPKQLPMEQATTMAWSKVLYEKYCCAKIFDLAEEAAMVVSLNEREKVFDGADFGIGFVAVPL